MSDIGIKIRKWERRALVVGFLFIPVSFVMVELYPPVGLWMLLPAGLMCLFGPLLLAMHTGGNPYSPRGWQAYCARHRLTYYRHDGCHYCAFEREEPNR